MKFLLRATAFAALGIVTAGCVTAPTENLVVEDTTFDGMVRIVDTDMDATWVRPGFDPNAYTKIMFGSAGIEYRPVTTTQFPVSDANKRRLQEIVAEEFRKELVQIEEYEITNEAGPETLLVIVGLLDVASQVPPQSAGRYEIYLSEVGSAVLFLEFRDSNSGAVLVRGADRRAAAQYGGEFGRSSSVTNWAAVRRLATVWASGLRTGIDEMRTANN